VPLGTTLRVRLGRTSLFASRPRHALAPRSLLVCILIMHTAEAVSQRLPASKCCDGQGNLRSVVARVATTTGCLQKAATTHHSAMAAWVTLSGPPFFSFFFSNHTPFDLMGLAGNKLSSYCVIDKKLCALLPPCITPAFTSRCCVNLLCQSSRCVRSSYACALRLWSTSL
jgi:hypothetical protein